MFTDEQIDVMLSYALNKPWTSVDIMRLVARERYYRHKYRHGNTRLTRYIYKRYCNNRKLYE